MCTRVCTGCELEKPLEEFDKTSRTLIGCVAKCKSCMSIYQRAYREKNKEKRLEYQRNYRRKNHIKLKEKRILKVIDEINNRDIHPKEVSKSGLRFIT